jgi:cellulose synthase/poly-beta-1,6-N-acetylglucosamine synthase-like glycosyltransferase
VLSPVVRSLSLRAVRRCGDRHAGIVLLGGLVAAVGLSARAWRQDRALALRCRAARLRPPAALTSATRISIMVAAWNERPIIERHIESVLSLRYPNVEYLLAAGGADGTLEIARRHERYGVIVLEQRHGEGKQAALRRCLERATGDIVYLTDADCLLDDDSFERTLRPILDGRAEASTGGSRPLADQLERSVLATYRWSVDAYTSARASEDATGMLGRNAAVTRLALDRAGGLRADVPTGTDYHLAKSLVSVGCRIAYVRESEVPTRYSEDVIRYARQQRRWLRNVCLFGWRFGAYDEAFASLRTSFTGLGMLLAPAACWPLGRMALSLWMVALAYSALSKVRYLAFAALATGAGSRRTIFTSCLLSPLLTVTELAVWASPLLDYLMPTRRRVW